MKKQIEKPLTEALSKKDFHKSIEELKEFMFGSFATKKDLESFATKKDLESFATKKDLESFATKKDLESFATKKDVEDIVETGLQNFAKTELKKVTLQILDAIEETDKDTNKQLANHEKRITSLELAKN